VFLFGFLAFGCLMNDGRERFGEERA